MSATLSTMERKASRLATSSAQAQVGSSAATASAKAAQYDAFCSMSVASISLGTRSRMRARTAGEQGARIAWPAEECSRVAATLAWCFSSTLTVPCCSASGWPLALQKPLLSPGWSRSWQRAAQSRANTSSGGNRLARAAGAVASSTEAAWSTSVTGRQGESQRKAGGSTWGQ